MAELALVFAMRSPTESAWRVPWNPYLATSVIASLGLVAFAVFLPVLQGPLGTVGLSGADVGLVLTLALAPFVVVETGKLLAGRLGLSVKVAPGARG